MNKELKEISRPLVSELYWELRNGFNSELKDELDSELLSSELRNNLDSKLYWELSNEF